MFNLGKPIGSVTDSSPSLVRISISSMEIFELYKSKLSVGQFILIASGNNLYLLTTITAIRVSQIDNSQDVTEGNMSAANSVTFRFQVDTQPIGTLSQDGGFTRGYHSLPVPTEHAYVTPPSTLSRIFSEQIKSPFSLGSLSIAPDVNFEIDGDHFFSKHIAIVGSTGSGKSCAVAKILQTVVGIESNANTYKETQKNSHIVIFDIHAEYAAAFRLDEAEKFSLNLLDVETLMLVARQSG